MSVTTQTLSLQAADGYPLQATLYEPAGPYHAQLIVAGATGVPQAFYRRFAEHAARQGWRTLTLDYRGIGRSAPATLKGFRMNYLDWARLDLAAAVDHMADLDPTRPLNMVGHSYGGHAFGLLPNHDKVQAFCTFATGAGWHGWMPPLERLRVRFMWQVLGPLMTRWKGYLSWSQLGMGEDLPLDVFRQWKHWCRFPHYFFDDPALPGLKDQFATVRTPIMAINATDDLWAPPASRDAFMQAYRNSGWQARTLHPKHSGLGPIGHMGYFRPKAQALWDEALHWLAANSQVQAKAVG